MNQFHNHYGYNYFCSLHHYCCCNDSIFFIEEKQRCPNCESSNIYKTGNRQYKESPPLAAFGSPDYYYKFEYKCNNCEHIFWVEQKSTVFN